MSTDVAEEVVSKPRRRSVAKSTKGQASKSVKIGLYLSPESAKKLGVTSAMEGRDRSAIVDALIAQHLRKYVVQVRSDRTESAPQEVSAT